MELFALEDKLEVPFLVRPEAASHFLYVVAAGW